MPFLRLKARDGRRLVSLSPGLRLLAVRRGHQHAAVVRGAHGARSGGGGGPDPVGARKGGHRRIPPDPAAELHARTGPAADHLERGPPAQAIHSGAAFSVYLCGNK